MKKYSKQTLRMFAESKLSLEHMNQMGIRDVDKLELKKKFPKMRFNDDLIFGHEIPYLDISGRPTGFSRYRLYDESQSFPKYLQIAGQASRFYFPPFMEWKKIAADPSIPIYITEGERKAASACAMGIPCIGLGGVWNWRRKGNEEGDSQPIKDFQLIEWKNRKTIIVFDSDSQFNSNIQKAIKGLKETLIKFGADPYRKDLPHKAGNSKVGLDDFLKAKGIKSFEKIPLTPLLLNKTMTGKELLAQKYAPTKWIIQGLIPNGLTILAGPPKIGKSWLILEFILAITTGRRALDHYETTISKCLYLALEDDPSRLKKRLLVLMSAGHKVNELSSFANEWARAEDNGLQILEQRLDNDPEIKVVFIDTLAKMRHAPRGRENLYHQDYEAIGLLKKIADKRGIGIVVVHHTKKGVSDDYLESVSGSMGITGAADTIIVIQRTRADDEAVMNITGRDVGDQSIAFSFGKGVWKYKGDARKIHATETQEEILEILRTENRPLRQKEIADLSGRKNGGLTKTLARMLKANLVVRKGYFFSLPEEQSKEPLKFALNPSKKAPEGY